VRTSSSIYEEHKPFSRKYPAMISIIIRATDLTASVASHFTLARKRGIKRRQVPSWNQKKYRPPESAAPFVKTDVITEMIVIGYSLPALTKVWNSAPSVP